MAQTDVSTRNGPVLMDDGTELAVCVSQARAGKKGAFERLVGCYQEKVFRLVYYRIRSTTDAEDLTQEIFLKAYKNLPKLKEDGKFKSWLYSIALNRARDYLRRKKLVSLFSDTKTEEECIVDTNPTQDNDTAAEQVARAQFWKQVARLSKMLSKREKEVFMLRFMDDLGIREIAEVIKQSESTVKTHLYRAIDKFRKDGTLKGYLLGER